MACQRPHAEVALNEPLGDAALMEPRARCIAEEDRAAVERASRLAPVRVGERTALVSHIAEVLLQLDVLESLQMLANFLIGLKKSSLIQKGI